MALSTSRPRRAGAVGKDYTDDQRTEDLKEWIGCELEDLSDMETEDGNDKDWKLRKAKEPTDDDHSGSDSDSEGEGEEVNTDDEEDEGKRRNMRAPMCKDHLSAINTLCTFLQIDKKQLPALRKGLKYVVAAIHSSDTFAGKLRSAHQALQWEVEIKREDLDKIIAIAETLAKSEDIVGSEAIGQAFGKLAQYNGGYLTTVSHNLPVLYGIAMMAQMVDKLPEYKTNGSAQQTSFAMLLNLHGLQGDAPMMLAEAFSTDTEIDSVKAHANELKKALDQCTQEARIAALVGQLAQFATVAKGQRERLKASGFFSSGTGDRREWDRSVVRSAGQTPAQTHTVTVVCALVVRNKPWVPEAHAVATFRQSKGVEGAEEAEYPVLKYFKEPVECPSSVRSQILTAIKEGEEAPLSACGHYREETQEWWDMIDAKQCERISEWKKEKRHNEIKQYGQMQIPFRAATQCKVPGYDAGWSGQVIVEALLSLLRNAQPADDKVGQKLKAFLDYKCPDYRNTTFGIPLKNAYLAVRKSRDVRIGRDKQNSRSLAKPVGNAVKEGCLGRWIALDGTKVEQVVNLLPPWLLYTPGVWEFYLLLDQQMPPPKAFSHSLIRKFHREHFDQLKEAMIQREKKQAGIASDEDFKYALRSHSFTSNYRTVRRKHNLTEEETEQMDNWGELAEAEAMKAIKQSDAYNKQYVKPGLNLIKYHPTATLPLEHPDRVAAFAKRNKVVYRNYPGHRAIYEARLKTAEVARAKNEEKAAKYFQGLMKADAAAAAEPGGEAYEEAAKEYAEKEKAQLAAAEAEAAAAAAAGPSAANA